jgi:hypothetical protein
LGLEFWRSRERGVRRYYVRYLCVSPREGFGLYDQRLWQIQKMQTKKFRVHQKKNQKIG